LTEYHKLFCDAVADQHVHPDYSFDAEGSIDDYCRMALNIGLKEICFTTHYDADPARLDHEGYMMIKGNREAFSDDSVAHYLKDIKRARDEFWEIGVQVRGGFEFGFFPGCEKMIGELKNKFNIEYSLGAVHSIDGLCMCMKDDAEKLFAKYTLPQLADRYYEILDQCAAGGVFDCLAHIEVYRRYGQAYYGEEVLTIHRGRIEKLFETMNRHGVGFELNTSAIRHGLSEYYPNMEIVNMARGAGTRLMALGSDAHRPDQLALDFDAATAVAYELIPYVDE
jgi:histidinol-phosphatase (PHP family)